jgi:hypothetical protein
VCKQFYGVWGVCCTRMGAGANGKANGTYLGVVGLVLRSRSAVFCTVCRLVSDLHGHVRGRE